jgi:arsenate reductase
MEKQRVLFLCTSNSARSQMAEALLSEFAGETFEVHSAGLEPTVINPLTIKVLKEIGIDASGQTAKPLSSYSGKMQFNYMITVCADAEERCPFFPGAGIRLHWPIEAPAAFKGSADEKIDKFREIRDQIKTKILSWLDELDINFRF